MGEASYGEDALRLQSEIAAMPDPEEAVHVI